MKENLFLTDLDLPQIKSNKRPKTLTPRKTVVMKPPPILNNNNNKTDRKERSSIIKKPPQPTLQEKESYSKVRQCKYCEIIYPLEELNYKMTLKMIMQTDRHLQMRGKDFSWLSRYDISHLNLAMMFKEHLVCHSCFTLYEEIQRLLKVEFEFAKKVGIPVKELERYHHISITSFNDSTSQKNVPAFAKVNTISENLKKIKPNINWGFDIPVGDMLLVLNNQPRENNTVLHYLCRYRFMIFIHLLRDIPSEIDISKTFWIEYTFFEQKIRYQLDHSQSLMVGKSMTYLLNRIRIFYFFCSKREKLNNFLNDFQKITMNLYCENDLIGQTSFDITEFISENVIKINLLKYFSVPQFEDSLNWGLNVCFGIVGGKSTCIDRIELSEHYGIYLPKPEYYSCEPFPFEWSEQIKDCITLSGGSETQILDNLNKSNSQPKSNEDINDNTAMNDNSGDSKDKVYKNYNF